jgi:putative nucleotidyltransferase with HDIG domain
MNEFRRRASILEKRATYQGLFYIVITAAILLRVFLKMDPRLFLEGTFVAVCIFMGIGFRHKNILILLIGTGALSSLSGYLSMMAFRGIDLIFYLFHWGIYFLLTLMIKLLIERYQTEQEDTLTLVITLSKTLDARDPYTASHSENVAHYAALIAEKMRLSPRESQNIYIGALLHDIGKIGVPENILNKPSQLTESEFEHIKQHPQKGYEMVNHITKFKKKRPPRHHPLSPRTLRWKRLSFWVKGTQYSARCQSPNRPDRRRKNQIQQQPPVACEIKEGTDPSAPLRFFKKQFRIQN